jgi:hypothetical protein
VILLVLLATGSMLRADEQDDSAVLSQTLSEIRAALPAAWKADIAFTPGWHDRTLTLLIATREPVAVRYELANSAGGEESDNHVGQETYKIALKVRPFMSPTQYADAKKQNQTFNDRRMKAQKELVAKGVKWGFMGPMPIPPAWFKPKNDAERELLQKYALIWMNTEPTILPTHYRGSNAFFLADSEMVLMVDPARAGERADILKRLGEILTPYESKD